MPPAESPVAEPASPTRPRAAVVAFADVVGYSTLMSADERGTYTRWMALLDSLIVPAVERSGGRIVDMAGDGILAEFPSVPNAVTWARAVQSGVRTRLEGPGAVDPVPIALRIGIHAGEVFETGRGLFGDAVNFAARLQAHAAPGGIALSERARADLGDAGEAELRDLGYADFKGFARRARIFAIEADVIPIVASLHSAGGLPSIAVLPLFDQSQGQGTAHLADGFAEDISMSLAGLRELTVIATGSTSAFRGRLPDPREVGRALGVGYALLGRMHHTGSGDLAVSVQLCDTRTGAALWGERLRLAPGDLFDAQDDIVRRVLTGLAPQVREAELQRALRKRPESLTAYDRLLRALQIMASSDHETYARARGLLGEAMEEDPGFALPVAWAARWHSVRVGRGWSPDPEADGREALDLASRAVSLDRHNALALATLGHLRSILSHDLDGAMQCFRDALDACPNHALAWTLSSGALSYQGRGTEAVHNAERGLALSPRDPMRYAQFMFLGIAHYASGHYADAVLCFRRSASENPLHQATLMGLTASCAAANLLGEARQVAQRFLSLWPGFSLDAYTRRRIPFREPTLREGFLAHLRAAGLPD